MKKNYFLCVLIFFLSLNGIWSETKMLNTKEWENEILNKFNSRGSTNLRSIVASMKLMTEANELLKEESFQVAETRYKQVKINDLKIDFEARLGEIVCQIGPIISKMKALTIKSIPKLIKLILKIEKTMQHPFFIQKEIEKGNFLRSRTFSLMYLRLMRAFTGDLIMECIHGSGEKIKKLSNRLQYYFPDKKLFLRLQEFKKLGDFWPYPKDADIQTITCFYLESSRHLLNGDISLYEVDCKMEKDHPDFSVRLWQQLLLPFMDYCNKIPDNQKSYERVLEIVKNSKSGLSTANLESVEKLLRKLDKVFGCSSIKKPELRHLNVSTKSPKIPEAERRFFPKMKDIISYNSNLDIGDADKIYSRKWFEFLLGMSMSIDLLNKQNPELYFESKISCKDVEGTFQGHPLKNVLFFRSESVIKKINDEFEKSDLTLGDGAEFLGSRGFLGIAGKHCKFINEFQKYNFMRKQAWISHSMEWLEKCINKSITKNQIDAAKTIYANYRNYSIEENFLCKKDFKGYIREILKIKEMNLIQKELFENRKKYVKRLDSLLKKIPVTISYIKSMISRTKRKIEKFPELNAVITRLAKIKSFIEDTEKELKKPVKLPR